MQGQQPRKLCASCGAVNGVRASFCGVCGQALPGDLLAPEGPEGLEAAPVNFWPEPVLPPQAAGERFFLPGVEASAGTVLPGEVQAAPVAQEVVAQKRCSWCGGMSSWVAEHCDHCGAHFPVPEQDEAFRRSAEDRLRSEEAQLDYLRERRYRNGWNLFRRRRQ